MKFLSGVFTTGDGQNSMMRVMCILALINAIAMGWYVLITGVHDTYMVEVFLGVAFAGKVSQKMFERPYNNDKATTTTTVTKDSSSSSSSSEVS